MADWCPIDHCDTDKTIQNMEFLKWELNVFSVCKSDE